MVFCIFRIRLLSDSEAYTTTLRNAQYKSARSIDNSGGGSSSKQYSGSISAGLTSVIVKQDYDADRSYTFMNKGNVDLQFGLSIDGINIDGTSVTLQSGDEISRDASDLSGSGEFLIVIKVALMGSIK